VGKDRCNSARIYVLEIPQFNASMAPNGAMRVQSGLLLRVQNEAELAAVLGHEFAHFELRHGLNGFKQRRSSSDVGAWIQVLGGISSTNTGNLQAAVLGTQYSFSRAQETDADLLSMKYMARSPYQASAAASVWDYVMAEDDARSAERGKKVQRRYTAGFFDTHPTSLARSTYLKEEAARLGMGGELRSMEYREAMRPFLPRFLAAQVKSNDFGGSEYLLQAMSQVEGWTGELLFARGELYRQRANPRDLASASDMFRQAIAKGYAQPEVHRELGLSLLRNGQQSEGRAALQQYLSLKPDATDGSVIKMLVGN
jgi:predicted Zn-dependent protease